MTAPAWLSRAVALGAAALIGPGPLLSWSPLARAAQRAPSGAEDRSGPGSPGVAGSEGGGTPAGPAGTFRLSGTARVSASPVYDRELPIRADAVLAPGPRPSTVTARLASEGYSCDLVATAGAGGSLLFEPGQRCTVGLRSGEARGNLVAVVRSGSGRLEGESLALDLSCDVTGALSLKAGGGTVLGAEVPSTWLPEVPVHGRASASANGRRDRSRASR